MTDTTIYSDLNYPHVTDLDLQMAELIYPILVEIAPSGDTITYQGVVEAVRERHPNIPEVKRLHHRHIGRRLGTIWQFTESQGCPHIGALVINKNTGECGKGLTEFLNPVLEREKIKSFEWATVELGFNNYLKKVKAAAKIQEIKLKKRSYDEAKKILFDLWNEVKSEFPISSAEIAGFRDELIANVQKGYSPATVLSDKLLALLNAGRLKSKPTEGFVYIGEYRNSETGESLFDEVKIGYTNNNIEDRATALSGGVKGPLEFVMTYAWCFQPGLAYIAEQSLHGLFDNFRRKGEFFMDMDGLLGEWASEAISNKYDEKSKPILIDGERVTQ